MAVISLTNLLRDHKYSFCYFRFSKKKNIILGGYSSDGTGDSSIIVGGISTSEIRPETTSGAVDLGSSSNKFKDLYLSGNIIGGSTITGDGSASADVIGKSGTIANSNSY